MKKLICLVAMIFASAQASATLIAVSGPNSTAGTAASIISAPSDATNASVTNTGQQGFDEAQGVVLASDLAIDGGVIAAGTRVDSHMIFLNSPGGTIYHNNVLWEFGGAVLGVMSDYTGALEAASAFLGAVGTTYQGPFNARGMEGADAYSIAGNTLSVSMGVSQPGDWIRVITVSDVPEPGTLLLLGLGLVGLRFGRKVI